VSSITHDKENIRAERGVFWCEKKGAVNLRCVKREGGRTEWVLLRGKTPPHASRYSRPSRSKNFIVRLFWRDQWSHRPECLEQVSTNLVFCEVRKMPYATRSLTSTLPQIWYCKGKVRQVSGTCGCGEELSGFINVGNFLTSCKVYWLASQEGLCAME